MAGERVNYDPISSAYDRRYAINQLAGVANALRSLAQNLGEGRVLEVGCGTGRWLAELQPIVRWVYGLDLSPGMLQQAQQRPGQVYLTRGQAGQLPFPDAVFDLVFCVNALHHFDQPHRFICAARRLLRPGGVLAIVGMDPHSGRDRWFLYDYFEGTYDLDLNRFPSGGTVLDWMVAAGFDEVGWRLVERIMHHHRGREVLTDHFVQKHGTSQLTLLTDVAYAAGLARLEADVAAAEVRDEALELSVDISLAMVTGRVQV